MNGQTQLPLFRLSHTNNMFKYNSILKLNELKKIIKDIFK